MVPKEGIRYRNCDIIKTHKKENFTWGGDDNFPKLRNSINFNN